MDKKLNIMKCIDALFYEIKRDTFNLTQIDHDAIEIKINELKTFIFDRYASHGEEHNEK